MLPVESRVVFITYQLGSSARRLIILLAIAALPACESSEGPAGTAGTASATSDDRRGELLSYACLACHSLDQGGGHQIGPNLSGVFGREAGSLPDFAYSKALLAADFVWTPAELDNWLADPAGFLPGTSMAFTGYQQAGDRQALIDFLVAATTP
jgi:cytochrome c